MANPRPRGCCIRAAEVREGSATHRRRLQKIRSKPVGCNTTAPRPRGRCITAAVVREGSGGERERDLGGGRPRRDRLGVEKI